MYLRAPKQPDTRHKEFFSTEHTQYLFAAILVGLTAPAAAQQATWSDWPQFLGPDRNGASPEKGLLRSWPEDGPKLLWKMPVPAGFGTPSVSKGEVFLLGRIGRWGKTDQGRSVRCLDAFTGEPRWEFKYATRKDPEAARKMQPGWGYCPRATATVTDAYVYTIDELGEMYCLDRKTGKEVWFRDLDADFTPSHSDWKGWCASPLIVDGRLILPTGSTNPTGPPSKRDARFSAFDPETGKPLWTCTEPPGKSRFGGASISAHTPTPVTLGGESGVLACANGRLLAIRVKDGAIVWRQEGAQYQEVIPNVQAIGDCVFVTPFDDPARCFQVDFAKPPFESKLLWKTAEKYAPVAPGTVTGGYSTWVHHKGFVYGISLVGVGPNMGDSTLYCLELATGKVMWKKEWLAQKHGGSILLADGLLIARAASEVTLIEADPAELKLRGTFNLKGKGAAGSDFGGWVMPVVAYGRLYLRTEGEVSCYAAIEKPPAREEIAR